MTMIEANLIGAKNSNLMSWS